MDFAKALDRLKWGQPMTREAWGNPQDIVFRLNPPRSDKYARRSRLHATPVVWTPTPDDMAATDWQDAKRDE